MILYWFKYNGWKLVKYMNNKRKICKTILKFEKRFALKEVFDTVIFSGFF